MKQNEEQPLVAPGVAKWRKKKAHEEIMAKINTVRGYYSLEEDYDLYPVRQWNATELPLNELKEILQNGNSSEIIALINRYGAMAQNREYGPLLPTAIQLMLVKRANPVEINAYTAYQGFYDGAQEVILNEWPPELILSYLSKHGLCADMQRKLLARNNQTEIATHIRHHGLADEVIVEMFDKIKQGGNYSLFYLFMHNHSLSVCGQIKMLETVNTKAFLNYITCYGLWEDAHEALINNRPMEEVRNYLRHHSYLCPHAEDALVRWPEKQERHELLLTYAQNWKGITFKASDHFLMALLQAPELDYEVISEVFINMQNMTYGCSESDNTDIELMANGAKEDILARIASGETLHIRALAELFYRNEPEWLKAYIAKCPQYSCYHYHF